MQPHASPGPHRQSPCISRQRLRNLDRAIRPSPSRHFYRVIYVRVISRDPENASWSEVTIVKGGPISRIRNSCSRHTIAKLATPAKPGYPRFPKASRLTGAYFCARYSADAYRRGKRHAFFFGANVPGCLFVASLILPRCLPFISSHCIQRDGVSFPASIDRT